MILYDNACLTLVEPVTKPAILLLVVQLDLVPSSPQLPLVLKLLLPVLDGVLDLIPDEKGERGASNHAQRDGGSVRHKLHKATYYDNRSYDDKDRPGGTVTHGPSLMI
jgi:hypothetical protein